MDTLSWKLLWRQYGFITIMLLIFMAPSVNLYNLEDRLPLFKFGSESYMFGFSVAQHRLTTEVTGEEDTLLVVGAPTAKPIRSQRGGSSAPDRPGGVYYCPVTTNPNDCKRVQMDAGGNYIDDAGIQHIKSDQWLGVSLQSQGPGGFLVSCAHRYAQQLVRNGEEEERLCGKCFLLNATSSRSVVEIPANSESLSVNFISTPCDYLQQDRRGQLYRKVRYGYMQAGSSISLGKDEYILGTPGAFRWSGGLFDIGMPEYSPKNGIESIFEPTVSSPFYRTPTCFPREWGPDNKKCARFPLERDSYAGFSVATSRAIDSNSDDFYQAAGAPRGNHTGAVVFFKRVESDVAGFQLEPDYSNIVMGPTVGSSFGHSVALTDINADGLDDLIVGAPQYYEYGVDRKAGGAAFVYINEEGSGFRDIEPQVFYGPLESYFGHSVNALGDIDQDGYGDFAVGSPYENENGVVHIFRGSANGNVKKSQTIKGNDYSFLKRESGQELLGFGASLSGAVDADGNKYPDLLIGSFSDHAALVRSRPIISINMSLEVDREVIDLEEKPCLSGGEEFSCFQISYCFQYNARHNEYTGEIPIRYKIVLDSIRHERGKVPRTYLDSKDGLSEIVNKLVLPQAGFRVCPGTQGTRDVYFGNGVQDRLSNIGVQIEFDLDLSNDVKRERVGEEIFDLIKVPILDEDFEKEKKKVVRIKNTCGIDGCQSNLKINATMPSEVVVGNVTSLPLTIYISNDREEAHQAHLTVALPSNVDFESFSVKSNNSKIVCFSSNTGEDKLIRCDLGNPYKSGEDEIEITIGVSRLTAKDKMIQVSVEGYTSSENPDIPPIYLPAYVWIELDLSLTLASKPQQVSYAEKKIYGESGMNTTEDIGPPIQYTFDIKNKGLGEAAGIELSINLPMEIFNEKWLLYLVTSGVTSGGGVPAGKCSSEYVNILRLEPSLPVSDRIKRDIDAELSPNRMVQTTLSCSKNTRCVNVRCLLDVIPGDTTTSVILQVRLWEATFLEEKSLKRLDLVHIYTEAQLTTKEENVRFVGDSSGMVQTTVDHDFFKENIVATFPWWFILIAVIALLILYILIIFLLIKCGFFKRKRRQQEDQEDDAVLEEN